jgi:hypothetical protein
MITRCSYTFGYPLLNISTTHGNAYCSVLLITPGIKTPCVREISAWGTSRMIENRKVFVPEQQDWCIELCCGVVCASETTILLLLLLFLLLFFITVVYYNDQLYMESI